MFDLRHLEHSTIIYEDPQHHPLLRLAWNKQDPNYLATMAMDAMEVRLEHEQKFMMKYFSMEKPKLSLRIGGPRKQNSHTIDLFLSIVDWLIWAYIL